MISQGDIDAAYGLFRQELENYAIPIIEPLEVDSWVARSALQKAIRRGLTDIALSAAATLFQSDAPVLWRRLLVTALEDVGVGEPILLQRIAWASTKTGRSKLGADWRIAAYIVQQACAASKCQAANELVNIAAHSPEIAKERAILRSANQPSLLAMISDTSCNLELRHCAVEAYLAVHNESFPIYVKPLIDAIFGNHPDSPLADLYFWALRSSRLSLAASSGLVVTTDTSRIDLKLLAAPEDTIEETSWICGAPAFALDQYTRWGRNALRQYMSKSSRWTKFAEQLRLTNSASFSAAAELLFRVEGAAVVNRRHWELGDDLRSRSRHLGCYIPECAVVDGLGILTRDLPLIDCLRRHTFRH